MSGFIKFEIWPDQRNVGGQHVGTGPNGVRGVHYHDAAFERPSGIEAICETERSQHRNKNIVQQMIEWAVSEARW